ncbi:MAG: 6-pyruvoyl-tetrahydropterin synthase-related protein [Actinomycetota bacterium]|nr:6-pyruvoyl-tetrahydropterin synthase-related protein [Actinomycetota bacterium]
MLRRLRQLPLETVITLVVVGGAALFVFFQLSPSLIFKNTTPAGGDTGAHVWAPDYLAHHLLPEGRITGWAPAWYAGFPAYHFYFPLPSLLIVVLSGVLPYGVAFKIVTVLGLVSLPVAAWAFGKLLRLRFPGPVLLAVATVPFLFDRSFNIYGGNIASTLAGEFSFSISLSLALLFLGVVGRGLDTGRHRALAAVLLAMTGLSHLLPTLFAVSGAVVLLLLRPGRARLKWIAAVLGVGALLAAFWSLPFLARLPYANDMGWEKLTAYTENLFHKTPWIVIAFAAGGAVASVLFRNRVGLALIGMGTIAGVAFVMAPEGRLWNARALPFWYLCLYLLAAIAVLEIGTWIASALVAEDAPPSRAATLATPVVTAVVVLLWMATPLHLGWLPTPSTNDVSFVPSWARWNYSGYEGKDAYPEYKGLVDTMERVGQDHGCGRAHWEYESGQDRFGTPMALMLLPYWTDQCIQSMEGLYFESSATTPYHFMNAGELSKAPSNPQRDLHYESLDVAEGVEQLQLLGVRYYMAFSAEAIAQAEKVPALTEIARSGQWRIYQVAGSQLVAPLAYEPAVLTDVGKGNRAWLEVSAPWYTDPSRYDVLLAADGPANWPRVKVTKEPSTSTQVGDGVTVATPPREPVRRAAVSGLRVDDNKISFDVDEPGTPVLVKASYFPNWKAGGAEGPYRVTPNLMVVVPTERHVTLHYGWTPVDVVGVLLTLLGIALTVVLAVRRPVDFGDADKKPDQPEQLTLDLPLPSVERPVTVPDRGR